MISIHFTVEEDDLYKVQQMYGDGEHVRTHVYMHVFVYTFTVCTLLRANFSDTQSNSVCQRRGFRFITGVLEIVQSELSQFS